MQLYTLASHVARRDATTDLRRARVEKWNGTTRHAHDRVRWSTDARLPIPRVTAANIARKTSAALLANRMDPRRYEAPVYMQLDDTLLSASDQAGLTKQEFSSRDSFGVVRYSRIFEILQHRDIIRAARTFGIEIAEILSLGAGNYFASSRLIHLALRGQVSNLVNKFMNFQLPA